MPRVSSIARGLQPARPLARPLACLVLLALVDAGALTAGGVLAAPLFPNPAQAIDGAPKGIVAADFDGDGRLDVAVPSGGGSAGVSILLGRGDGTFRAAGILGAGETAGAAAVGDFNGDHRPDMAISWSGAPRLTIEIGRGDGTFERRQTIPFTEAPASIAVGDLDGDDDEDLVLALFTAKEVRLLTGGGGGTFAPGAILASAARPLSVALADCNGDGRLDIASGDWNSGSMLAGGRDAREFAAIADTLPDVVALRIGRGDGSFADPATVPLDGGPQAIAAADFTGDGLSDLGVALAGPNRAAVLAGRADGGLEAPQYFGAGREPAAVAATDANGDGLADLAVANAESGDVTTHLATGVPPVIFRAAIPSRAGEGPAGVVAGDFDGDQVTDLAVANATSRTVSVLAGRGAGRFGGAPTFETGPYPRWLALGHIDGNRTWDVAVASSGAPNVSVLLGRGDGGFDPGGLWPVGGIPWSVSLADLNADGRVDLVAPLADVDRVAVLPGAGAGGFGAASLYTAGWGPAAAAAGDFDRDGLADLAVANLYSDNVSILRGRDGGGFEAPVNIPAGDGPWSIHAADMDGDRIPDLVLGENGPITPTSFTFGLGDVGLLRGLATGGFSPVTTWPAGPNPRVIALGDFNGDGRPDVAAANLYDDMSVILNDGHGGFGPRAAYRAGVRPESVATGDLDADGIADLVVANSQSGDLSVFPGRGDGTFGAGQRFVAGRDPYSVGVADLDGDRRQDIVVANLGSSDLWVLLNRGPFPDTDRDGIPDNVDPCTDSDGDGYGDPDIPAGTCPHDNCPAAPNPGQDDADGDGAGDACDACPLDPLDDADHDGVCADEDTCPALPDPAQGDADGDHAGDLCDNCPAAPNPGQEDANADGSGDACQPALDLLRVRPGVPGSLVLLLRARDPQDEPLSGAVDLVETIGHPATLADLGSAGDCAQGLFPRGVAGEGIGYANGSTGGPVLFDFMLGAGEFGLPCPPAANHYVVADRACDAPGPASFRDILAIGHLVPPAALCMARLDAAGNPDPADTFDVLLQAYDTDSADLTLLEVRRRHVPFAGGLPRSLDLAGLVTGAAHHLDITVTDGNTRPVTDGLDFDYDGETVLYLQTIGPPRAVITAPPLTECDRRGGALVTLDGSLSGAPGIDPGALSYAWVLDPGAPGELPLGSATVIEVVIPYGAHVVGLTVTDPLGLSGAAEAPVAVGDTAAPTLTVAATPAVLWPVDHRMVDVRVTLAAADLCFAPAVVLESIASSDPDDGPGDGGTAPDIDGAEIGARDIAFRLRAERSSPADRVYTITYRAEDGAGNTTRGTASVVVRPPSPRRSRPWPTTSIAPSTGTRTSPTAPAKPGGSPTSSTRQE